jgi:hypothetical protein
MVELIPPAPPLDTDTPLDADTPLDTAPLLVGRLAFVLTGYPDYPTVGPST